MSGTECPECKKEVWLGTCRFHLVIDKIFASIFSRNSNKTHRGIYHIRLTEYESKFLSEVITVKFS